REVRYFEVKPEERISELISVIFNVEPSDANLFVNGQETPVNQTTQLAPGSVEVRLEREGYRTITDVVEVNEENIQFNYSLEEIDIVPVLIQSNVEGASVAIDGTVRGNIDRGGGLGLFLYPGTYALSVGQTGYVTQNLTLEVTEEGRNETRVELVRNIGELALQVSPSDARILIDREDYSGQRLIELAPGSYRLNVESQGYNSYSETIEIVLNERTNVQVDLERNVGELALQIMPSNARVSLNRQDYSGKSLIELAPGRYRLDIELQGYEPYSESIEITLDEMISREISLQPYVGSLQFSVTPSNARVQLLNQSGKVVNEWTGIQLLRNVQEGAYTVKVSAEGHIPKEQRVDIQQDQMTQV
ncbi:MAG: PEGA domain-containing protein, partial [Gracilimonas sp.]